jgi:NAD-specific glutamate dehydrogenase
MAEKKKAYRRFEELTKQAMAPMEAVPDSGGGGTPSAEALPIWLSPEVRRALEQQAAADNATPSEIVEAVLRRYLEIRR